MRGYGEIVAAERILHLLQCAGGVFFRIPHDGDRSHPRSEAWQQFHVCDELAEVILPTEVNRLKTLNGVMTH